MNLLTSNLERWGDYSGSQRKYNSKEGDIWVSGYYAYSNGNYPHAHAAWVSQLTTDRNYVGIKTEYTNHNNEVKVFPNPANTFFSVSFQLKNPEYLSFDLYDVTGKKIETLLKDWVKVHQNTFSFDTRDLDQGIYILKISGSTTNISQKVIKN